MPKVCHESDEQNEVRVGKKAGCWIQPTNHVLINYFFKTHNNEEEHKENGYRFIMFIGNTVIEEKDEDEIEASNNNYEETKGKS